MDEANFRNLNFEPKGGGRDCSGSRLPPARFSWSPLFYTCGPPIGKPQAHWPRAQSRHVPGSRKPSVPDRVHSVPESYGSQTALCALPGSNPCVTHGTVESPGKLFFAVSKEQRAAAANQSCGLVVQHLLLVDSGSQKSVCLHCSIYRRATASNQSNWLSGPTPFSGLRRLSQIYLFFDASSGNIRLAS
jgi:hypothetical protein